MLVDMLEFFDWSFDAFGGWRYLLSRSFRQHTHNRWKVEGRGTAVIEILFGGISVLLTLFLLWLLIGLLRG